jgi:ubiquinone/menaquinone biosynthesis C-methylase UbiE
MRKEDYDLMHQLETDYWWFVGMRRITSALLSCHVGQIPRSILDVGCGTGINLLWLTRQYQPDRIVGCDFSAVALGWCAETIRNAPSSSKKTTPVLSRGDVRKLPFAGGSFDLTTNSDVLDLFAKGEDLQAMKEFYRVLRPGGVAFVRAPAYDWLLSSHDTLFETQHRFSVPELRDKMKLAGFEILKTTYANTLLFPLALVQRLLRKFAGMAPEKTDTQPWPQSLEWLNGPFTACLDLEAKWLAAGRRLPFGLSAICIGRKKMTNDESRTTNYE